MQPLEAAEQAAEVNAIAFPAPKEALKSLDLAVRIEAPASVIADCPDPVVEKEESVPKRKEDPEEAIELREAETELLVRVRKEEAPVVGMLIPFPEEASILQLTNSRFDAVVFPA